MTSRASQHIAVARINDASLAQVQIASAQHRFANLSELEGHEVSTVNNLNAAITLLLNLTAAAGKVSNTIHEAQRLGRDLTDAELGELQVYDDAARGQLVGAIEAAKAGGQ